MTSRVDFDVITAVVVDFSTDLYLRLTDQAQAAAPSIIVHVHAIYTSLHKAKCDIVFFNHGRRNANYIKLWKVGPQSF